MTRRARSKYSPERRVRSSSCAFSRSVRAATLEKVVVTDMAADCTWRRSGLSSAERRTPDLAARRLGQLVGEVDEPRILVRRGLGLDVLLQLARERLGRDVALAQHDDRPHDAAALLVRRGHH